MENLMKQSKVLFVALNLLGFNIFAQESNQQSSQQLNEVYEQESTIVTANRYQQDKNDVIPSITVIDREDILNIQANNILDLLSLQQGIDVARNGGSGGATSVFMRGTNSNHVLVLIDGMRVGSSFSGSFTWEHVPVSQIERIEIVRGTRVSYYGSDAIGGVINIITRNQDKLYARYTIGSFDTHNFDIGFGSSNSSSQYSIILGSQKTDGFSATNENNLFSFDPDKDGYENQSLNFNYSTQLNNGDLKINFLQANGDNDFDTGNSDSSERIARMSWSNTVFNDWNSEIALGNNFNQLDTQIFGSKFDSNRLNVDWLINKQIKSTHYSYGLTYRTEEADYINFNAPNISFSQSRNNLALFGNFQTSHKSNIYSVSGRFDNNNAYGSNFSTDISWAKHINQNNTLNISVGTAFHAPSINELYSPNFQGIVVSPVSGEDVFAFSFEGNPDLKPEESQNFELGLKSKLSNTQFLSFNYFSYKIDNLIDFQGPTFKPVNINEAKIKGIEANYSYQDNGLAININATIQEAKNSLTDSALLRRPDNKFNFSLDKTLNEWSIGSSLRYASKSPDFGVELDEYTVVDLRAAYKINQNWRIGLKVDNVLNESYQIVDGYNTPKNSGYLSIEWQQ